jgi:hypothetical protein
LDNNEKSVQEEDLYDWIYIGPHALTETAFGRGWCDRSNLRASSARFPCKGGLSGLSGPYSIHPIYPYDLEYLLLNKTENTGSEVRELTKNALGIHMHNFLLRKMTLLPEPGYVIADILKVNCPVVYELTGEDL